MSIYEEYLYIDYENVQDIKFKYINESMKVKIIVGENQVKVPIDLVLKIQPYGSNIEWIKVGGKGKNALDFFITFYLGEDVSKDPKKKFVIYSKDTGYDPLICHLKKKNINVSRIVSFQELNNNNIQLNEPEIAKVRDNLKKIASNKRPKKRNSLIKYITSLSNGRASQDIDKIIDDLFIKKIVYEENGIIKYSLEK